MPVRSLSSNNQENTPSPDQNPSSSKLPRNATPLGGRPELQDAIKDYFSYNVLPTCGVYRLPRLAFDGHGDYTWGYRIYRTTYARPDSDSRFAKAIGVLNDYIRYECFSYRDDGRQKGTIPMPPLDSKVNDQLWQRLRHDVIEDRALLEGASKTPGRILKLSQNWVHLDQKAKTGDSPRYRFFLVFDDEVIDHLLQLPAPENRKKTSPPSTPSRFMMLASIRHLNGPAVNRTQTRMLAQRASNLTKISRDGFGPLLTGWRSYGSATMICHGRNCFKLMIHGMAKGGLCRQMSRGIICHCQSALKGNSGGLAAKRP